MIKKEKEYVIKIWDHIEYVFYRDNIPKDFKYEVTVSTETDKNSLSCLTYLDYLGENKISSCTRRELSKQKTFWFKTLNDAMLFKISTNPPA